MEFFSFCRRYEWKIIVLTVLHLIILHFVHAGHECHSYHSDLYWHCFCNQRVPAVNSFVVAFEPLPLSLAQEALAARLEAPAVPREPPWGSGELCLNEVLGFEGLSKWVKNGELRLQPGLHRS